MQATRKRKPHPSSRERYQPRPRLVLLAATALATIAAAGSLVRPAGDPTPPSPAMATPAAEKPASTAIDAAREPSPPGDAPVLDPDNSNDTERRATDAERSVKPQMDHPPPEAADPPSPLNESVVTVRAGDNLTRLFRRAGLTAGDVHRTLSAGEDASALEQLRPGDQLTLLRKADGAYAGLRFPVDRYSKLHIRRADDSFTASIKSRTLHEVLHQVSLRIDSSLYLAASAAGLTNSLTMQLASVLGGEVDLVRDLRRGDQLSVVFKETLTPDQESLGYDLKAVRLDGERRELDAIRYTDPDGNSGFYQADGTNLAREFLRYPLEFTRISSHFDRNRRHPVLGVRRPHLGVDLAAPTGTPIRAAADGRIIQRGRNGGYGRMVSLSHGSRYETRYAHMSRFAPGQRVGSTVRRGQIIGYVGRSGLATGPHLHYEFLDHGRHRNPVTVSLPRAEPVAPDAMQDFTRQARPLKAALNGETPEGLRVARGDEEP